MSKVQARYDYGFNNSGTGQHEVIEYVVKSKRPTCRCMNSPHLHGSGVIQVEEGPYVILYTEQKCTAEAIAMLLNADGTDNNFPSTPMSAAIQYMNKRFAAHAEASPDGPYRGIVEEGVTDPSLYNDEVR